MAKIVAGFGLSHIMFEPYEVQDQADRIFDGMRDIARRIEAIDPDVIVLASNDHMNNFNLALQVPFIVGIADEYVPLGDMGIPQNPFKGHRQFAEQFVRFAASNNFDLAQAEEVRPDHGMALPMLFLNTDGTIPIVPLFINVGIDPPPTPARAWALGRVLKKMVEGERPDGESVVVIGAGGLSHWLCMPQQGQVAEEFDRKNIDALISGHGAELANLSSKEIVEQSGNGGLEIINWIFMAGCLPDAKGELIFYEPMPEWITGMGAVALTGT